MQERLRSGRIIWAGTQAVLKLLGLLDRDTTHFKKGGQWVQGVYLPKPGRI
jgi:hypothetical protein